MKFMLAFIEFPMRSNVSASSEPIRVSKLPYIFRWIIFRPTVLLSFPSRAQKSTSMPSQPLSGAPNENIVQNHLNIALLNLF